MYPPHAKLQRLVDAEVEPLSLTEARHFLRIEDDATGDEDDALIADLITAARMTCEQLSDRSFVTTTWRLTLDYLPQLLDPIGFTVGRWSAAAVGRPLGDDGVITLPMPPLIGLEAISYLDQSGQAATVDVSEGSPAVVVSPGTPGRISAGYARYFPFSRPTIAAVSIDYTAGYGPTADDVPRPVKQAIRLLVAHLYEHRSADAPVPAVVSNLLDTVRWGGYA